MLSPTDSLSPPPLWTLWRRSQSACRFPYPTLGSRGRTAWRRCPSRGRSRRTCLSPRMHTCCTRRTHSAPPRARAAAIHSVAGIRFQVQGFRH